jgi:hypothetical protein
LHIFEDEWRDKKEVLKKKILHLCGKTEKVIGARKLKFVSCFSEDITAFVNQYSIDPIPPDPSYCLKIMFENRIVGAVMFSEDDSGLLLANICTDQLASYPGLMGKVVAFTKKTYHYSQLTAFADLRLSTGDVYVKSGWQAIQRTTPDFYYVFNGEKVHQAICPPEWRDYGEIPRIYDCGKTKYTITW